MCELRESSQFSEFSELRQDCELHELSELAEFIDFKSSTMENAKERGRARERTKTRARIKTTNSHCPYNIFPNMLLSVMCSYLVIKN